MPKIRLYMPYPAPEAFAPVLSFNLEGHDSEAVGAALARQGVAVRCGLHCAPQAHGTWGTFETGTVRISPSVFTTSQQVDQFLMTMKKIVRFSS